MYIYSCYRKNVCTVDTVKIDIGYYLENLYSYGCYRKNVHAGFT